jgi:hypothetical protein
MAPWLQGPSCVHENRLKSEENSMSRIENILLVTKRLIIMAATSLLLISAIFGVALYTKNRLMVSCVVFGCGLTGGFVSIQQRLNKIGDPELEILSRSWFQILLIPIYGGIFALVLYVLFISGIIQGHLFPEFYIPAPEGAIPTAAYIKRVLLETLPSTGQDFTKLVFWSFFSGFSERYVPQVIGNVAKERSQPGGPKLPGNSAK